LVVVQEFASSSWFLAKHTQEEREKCLDSEFLVITASTWLLVVDSKGHHHCVKHSDVIVTSSSSSSATAAAAALNGANNECSSTIPWYISQGATRPRNCKAPN
jgi:hypothetical protein